MRQERDRQLDVLLLRVFLLAIPARPLVLAGVVIVQRPGVAGAGDPDHRRPTRPAIDLPREKVIRAVASVLSAGI